MSKLSVTVRVYPGGSYSILSWGKYDLAEQRGIFQTLKDIQNGMLDVSQTERQLAVLRILPVGGRIEGFGARIEQDIYDIELSL